MLKITKSELKLVSHGYQFDSLHDCKKYVQIFASLDYIKVRVKVQPHKEMHIKSISTSFPYVITDNWVEFMIYYYEIASWPGMTSLNVIENYIDNRCNEIWFV